MDFGNQKFNYKRRKVLEVKDVVECKIVKRLNRFVVEVVVNNKICKAYINNTGRLKDYIVKGTWVYTPKFFMLIIKDSQF